MLRHVKLFEQHITDAVTEKATAEVHTVKSVKLSRELEEKIKLAAALSKRIKDETERFKALITPMQTQLNKYDAHIMEVLSSVESTQARVDNIVAKMETQKGRITDSYKELFIHTLSLLNEATTKKVEEYREANKNKNPDKYWMVYNIETPGTATEAVKDVAANIAAWVKGVWHKFMTSIEDWKKKAEKVISTGERILAATAKNESDAYLDDECYINENELDIEEDDADGEDDEVYGNNYKELVTGGKGERSGEETDIVDEEKDPMAVTSKDKMRIEDIMKKAVYKGKGTGLGDLQTAIREFHNGTFSVVSKAKDLAERMAAAINDSYKALRRARAADAMGLEEIGKIFHKRYEQL